MSEGDSRRPIVNIEGELVALGPLREEHLPLYTRWMNEFDTTSRLGMAPRPFTVEQESAWFDKAASDTGPPTFTIYERATWRPIGNCGLHVIDTTNHRTDLGIMIGEPDARGKGYGTEAMRLLLDYAFTILGMHNVMLTVYAFNVPAIRSYEKVGFREFGRRRESQWHNGRYWDTIYMDILASEFESPVLRALLT